MRIDRRRWLCAGLGALVWPAAAAELAWPSRPIRFVVPYSAGGSADAVTRMIASKLAETWGQQVIVENRTGAGGRIGTDYVAKAAPDGYTVLIGITQLIQSPALYKSLPYKLSDFTPLCQITSGPVFLAVNASVPADNFAEFVALVKANPHKYSFGSYGAGTSPHIFGEMLKQQAGLDMTHVPYRGASAVLTDLLGGQIPVAFIDTGTIRPYLTSGKVKLLAVTGPHRHRVAPNVPTLGELGFKYFEPNGWIGSFVPAATPRDVVQKLSAEMVRILQSAGLSQRIDALGLSAEPRGADQFAELIRVETPIWAKAIGDTRITLD